MSTTPLPIQLLAVAASLVYLYCVVAALRRSRMAVRQSLLWIVSGAAFLVTSIFPQPLIWTADKFGFEVPSNAAFVVWLLALTALMFYQSLTTSRQTAQLKTLCQELAVLHAELEQQANK
ncbi:MAG: DUF2304 domain-containing protein [Phycisphaerae bacterium]|nr:DUF2304 domain-containing protein [Phycisphaerae bacterium]